MSAGARVGVALGTGLALLAAPQIAARVLTAGAIAPAETGEFTHANVALVLGARVWEDGRPSLFLFQRVDAAAQLLARGFVDRVVVSGAGHNREGLDETASMLRTALSLGIPRDAIDVDRDGHHTAASAHNAAHYGSVIVCSQEFHLPRAVMLARRAGLEAQGAYPRVLAKPHTYLGYARELPASWKALTGPHA